MQVGGKDKEPKRVFTEGFLINEDAKSFSVFVCYGPNSDIYENGPVLTTERIQKNPPAGPLWRCSYQAEDFKMAATNTLQAIQSRFKQDGTNAYAPRPVPGLVTPRMQIFALGRACAQRGLLNTGGALMKIAASIPPGRDKDLRPMKLRENLQREMGDALIFETERKLGDPTISWGELLNVYDGFGKRYPASDKIAYAQECAELLRELIAEDAAHHPKPLDEMSPSEQAAEYIYQLRNLKVLMWMQYGRYPDQVYDGWKPVTTCLDRLIDLGYAAAPQLIAALADRRFTRCIRESVHGWDPDTDMRVSDLAQIALERISGRDLHPQKDQNGNQVRSTRQLAEAWWAEVSGKGEKEMLVEATRTGGFDAVSAANELVQKYPDAALGAIEQAVHNAPEEWLRSQYIDAAAELPGDLPVEFLKQQLESRNGRDSQIAAAKGLQARGKAEAVTGMIVVWQTLQQRIAQGEMDTGRWQGRFIPGLPGGPPEEDMDIPYQVDEVATLLANSDTTSAIEALRKSLPKLPANARLDVVSKFVLQNPNAPVARQPAVGPIATAIERLLTEELVDTGGGKGLNAFCGREVYNDARVCDIAALALAQRWPGKYQFKWTESEAGREKQVARMILDAPRH